MSPTEIDAYLDGLDEPKRSTLVELRLLLAELLPEAEEGLSYGVPAFKVGGRAVAGFAAFASHLSYLPHSGKVLADLGEEVGDYQVSKGALKFPVDTPLPRPLVARLVETRLAELHGTGS